MSMQLTSSSNDKSRGISSMGFIRSHEYDIPYHHQDSSNSMENAPLVHFPARIRDEDCDCCSDNVGRHGLELLINSTVVRVDCRYYSGQEEGKSR